MVKATNGNKTGQIQKKTYKKTTTIKQAANKPKRTR